ncbi:flagellar hook-length control protein FliK [Thioalkalivibrio sp. ALJ16]|uniref:flagellar hook-length control protein FliK n=1 Tax=Thioalkalivibrio sp. ALJ16 TaxID=1158762 RepID=UPI0004776EA0|nr:flagellar hook-length control protein FliK [Thioalkalivibrio sp. ALJ16]
MADLSGPRMPGWTSPGTGATGTSSSERLPLVPGARIEVQLVERVGDRGVRLRLGPASTGATAATAPPPTSARPAAAPVVTAQVAGQLPEALLNRAPTGTRSPGMLMEVIRTEPRLEVRLMPLPGERAPTRPAAGSASQIPAQQWLGQELRQHLPGARPLAAALQSLASLAGTGLRMDAMAPATPAAPAPAALQRVLESLPTPGQLARPDTLRQQVQQSGVWLEAMLGQTARGHAAHPALAADLKAQLLRAADQLRQLRTEARPNAPATAPPAAANAAALPAMNSLLEGLLKRVTTLQLQSLQTLSSDESGNPRWFFELPLRSEQGLQGILAEIRREARAASDEEARWSIVLTLDLPGMGPTRIAVASRAGHIQVHFTASQPDTVARLRMQLPDLRERLGQRELQVAAMSVRQGEVDPEPHPRADARMLNEQA